MHNRGYSDGVMKEGQVSFAHYIGFLISGFKWQAVGRGVESTALLLFIPVLYFHTFLCHCLPGAFCRIWFLALRNDSPCFILIFAFEECFVKVLLV